MFEVIGHLLFAAAGIIGMYKAFETGNIFGKIADWLSQRVPFWVSKPLFDCPICMSSVWGITYIILVVQFKLWYIWLIPALAGLIALLCVLVTSDDNSPCD